MRTPNNGEKREIMANFATHLIGAATVGVVLNTVFGASNLLPFHDIPTGIALVILGGIFPDIDSDNSDALRLVFSLFGVIIGAFATIHMLPNWGILVSLMALGMCYALVRYVLVIPFRRFTVHRGLYHSVPMATLLSLLTCGFCIYIFHFSEYTAWMMACMFFAGYITHLTLDEIYSVDFSNVRIKRSFGTALKLANMKKPVSYLSVYALIILTFVILPPPSALGEKFTNTELRWLPLKESLYRVKEKATVMSEKLSRLKM